MNNDVIKDIINIAIWAPSGENCQPWRFELSGSQLSIFNLPERDQSLYSWGQRASYIAHGALIENIVIAGKHYGLVTDIQLFPDSQNKDKVAIITFHESTVEKDSLFNFIKTRISNRKPYREEQLTESEKIKLTAANEFPNSVSLIFVDEQRTKKELGYLAALNEKIIFENFFQHRFFFSHINWTKKEDDVKSIGFFIETLELPLPAKLMFKIIRHWSVMRLANFLKFGNLIAIGNGKINSSCSAFGAIKIKSLEKDDCIAAGRVIQKTWLTATSMDLQIQPLTGVLFLKLIISAGMDNSLSKGHIGLIENAYQTMCNYFNTQRNEFLLFMFRIGRGERATAHSSRLAPIIDIK